MNSTAAVQRGIQPFEAADYLQSDEDCAHYLQACMDQAPKDAALFAKAVGDIARARGMVQLARDTGLAREGLCKALGNQGNPSFAGGDEGHACTGLAVQRGCAAGAKLSARRTQVLLDAPPFLQ